jgi:hypothetical protein
LRASHETRIHEASHVAMALWLGQRVEWVRVDGDIRFPGEVAGEARIPIGSEVEPSRVAICLAGYLSTGEPGWPPSWPEALCEKREALNVVLKLLHADQEQYGRSVALTRDVLANSDFLRLRDAVARALRRVPHLTGADVEAICRPYLPTK